MKVRHISIIASIAALATVGGAVGAASGKRVGSFTATGTGAITVQGNMTAAFGKVKGGLVVRDRVGGAIVKVRGVKRSPTRIINVGGQIIRVYNFPRANGAFFVQGANVRIQITSAKEPVSATFIGRGRVTRLAGQGTYRLNDNASRSWVDAAPPIAITGPAGDSPALTRALTAAAFAR